MLNSIGRLLVAVFDALDSPSARSWLERAVVVGAAVGFLVHLAVIGVARVLPDLPGAMPMFVIVTGALSSAPDAEGDHPPRPGGLHPAQEGGRPAALGRPVGTGGDQSG